MICIDCERDYEPTNARGPASPRCVRCRAMRRNLRAWVWGERLRAHDESRLSEVDRARRGGMWGPYRRPGEGAH